MTLPEESRDVNCKSQEIWFCMVHPFWNDSQISYINRVILQTSNWSGTFFAVSYSKPALAFVRMHSCTYALCTKKCTTSTHRDLELYIPFLAKVFLISGNEIIIKLQIYYPLQALILSSINPNITRYFGGNLQPQFNGATFQIFLFQIRSSSPRSHYKWIKINNRNKKNAE